MPGTLDAPAFALIAGVAPGFAWALVLVLATAYAAHRIAWALVGHGPFALRWSGILVVGCWLASVGFFALLLTGCFRPLPASLGAVGLALASRLACRGVTSRRLLARDRRLLERLLVGARRSPWAIAALALLPFAALRLLRCLLEPPLGWDTLAYHGPRAALFVREGAFTFEPGPGTWGLYRNFFAGGEVLWAWTMLPFHDDMLLGLASGLLWLGVGLGAWALGRSLGLREPFAGLAGWVVLFVPVLQLEVPSGYVEPPLCMALGVCLAASLTALRRPHSGRQGLLVLAGMAAGVTAGIKPSGALPAATACVFVATALWRSAGSRAAGALAAAALAALLPALPFAIHAWLDTGAPLSPLPVRVLGLTLGVPDPHMQWFLERGWGRADAYTWRGEWAVLRALFAAPSSSAGVLGIFSALPLLLSPLGVARALRRGPAGGVMLAAVLAAIAVSFYLPSLSPMRFYFPVGASRYALALVVLCVPVALFGAAVRPRLAGGVAALMLGGAAFHALRYARVGWGPHASSQLLLGALCTAAVALATAGALRALRGHPPAIRAALVLLVGFVAVVALRDGQLHYREEAVRGAFQLHRSPRYWLEASLLVDRPDRSHTIAVTAGPSRRVAYWFPYYFLGRELQNRLRYLPITADGRIAPFDSSGLRRRLADRGAWLRRLEDEGVTHVMSFSPASIELLWMRSDPERFQELRGGRDWGLFRVVGREPGSRSPP